VNEDVAEIIEQLEDKPKVTKIKDPPEEQEKPKEISLSLDRISAYCNDLEDDYFGKAQKLTTVELGHAFSMAVKEKELEIALAMVKRKISRV
jgi:hypothetical protein